MIIHHLGNQNSLLQVFVDELRDINIQKDRMRFRRNVERIGEIMAYEFSKNTNYSAKEIQTPLAKTQVNIFKEQPVICSILRAGIALHNGVLSYLDQADNAFISAYRKMHDNGMHTPYRRREEGEAKRDDENFSYVAAWEFHGVGEEPTLHKEELEFEYVKLTQRSYK